MWAGKRRPLLWLPQVDGGRRSYPGNDSLKLQRSGVFSTLPFLHISPPLSIHLFIYPSISLSVYISSFLTSSQFDSPAPCHCYHLNQTRFPTLIRCCLSVPDTNKEIPWCDFPQFPSLFIYQRQTLRVAMSFGRILRLVGELTKVVYSSVKVARCSNEMSCAAGLNETA